jgi:hypothetical protein
VAVRTVLTCAAETEAPAGDPPRASDGSGQVDAVCLRALPRNRRRGTTRACKLLFERLRDKVHQADCLGHAVHSQLSVQRSRNPGRKLHSDDFFPPSHAPPSCRLLTTQLHGSASPPGDAPQTTGLGEPRKQPPVRERRSRRVQLGVRATGDGRITTGTRRGR